MKIFIRADGGKSIGMGHVMRMLVLACELRRRNKVIFICRNGIDRKYEAGINMIEEKGFEILKVENYNILSCILSLQEEYKADILITDTYEVDEEYFNILKPYFKLTGYVDDVNKCYMNVDFIINQNINAKYLDYSKTTKEEAKLFLGPKYCMIREEFKIIFNEKEKIDYVENILLTLGGMDDNNNTMKILNNIKELKEKIHVVLGNAFDENVKKQVYKLSKEYKNIYPYENSNMPELMKKCDIAISACGSTIYELCAMQVPAIGIIIADNQKSIAELMKKEKMISDIIDIEELESNKVLDSVQLLINDNFQRNEIKKHINNIVNLYGAKKLSEDIEKLYEELYE
ncbi:UDP-2,4-diacetamido-2,4,6-trideoxy-beta-L-altropyranose hydrolase [Clostridium neonatale]|uniref:UDP-2,4-diacetamido-2,4, 6-trideoxy-beta-L-altropyranose hydrolase n=1 Tax=Clostridium neonatale TaxID=137838 RepID=UPI00291B916F|nr:UDP-2,4-diacetamido-2,4, 6-trideoxy-beta-L-altropyranose hydrolase [Clostridium neonatale]CAI3566436.1 UDP-2,4-diacetamido-2,4, 6-trideoxy-beta-L-altropyranose hydrolase [Clostridium neonatale]CAI3639838.1 UDP-2,4-diacetamido-2,4, 6-trideoxy-beta-L-altropyranose hydrolase [Clostridium neonatale]CAI3647360.1 UDP-2,4-diacetamido-2,4, 6-trideoxy-beta-L-altropyranose hydrolase [Clostridium neonatale]CAI3711649.1 UDP-2,4-diacetamido-2,4, 6-trideoxy-beta-L-altropyranose hydrolase [Clostridium neon